MQHTLRISSSRRALVGLSVDTSTLASSKRASGLLGSDSIARLSIAAASSNRSSLAITMPT